jgi:hypothetical protein
VKRYKFTDTEKAWVVNFFKEPKNFNKGRNVMIGEFKAQFPDEKFKITLGKVRTL